jgi:hypothetical protein
MLFRVEADNISVYGFIYPKILSKLKGQRAIYWTSLSSASRSVAVMEWMGGEINHDKFPKWKLHAFRCC